jgi:CRP/FNR family transcriptional regulator, cyclic AMP receptor protein
VNRYLVVASQLSGDRLAAAIREASRRGASGFLLLVPATPPSGGMTWTDSQARMLAHDRLERGLKLLAEVGVDAEGRIGDPDPFLASQDAIREEHFDGVIVSAAGGARGTRHLVPRLREAVDVPVIHIAGSPESEVKERTLRLVPLFANLPRRRLRALTRAAITHDYLTGDTIVSPGTSDPDLFVVLDGRASVRKDGGTIASFAAGEFFGEISLLDPGPRTAEVVAEIPTRCLRLAGEDFWDVLDADPRLSGELLRHLGRRMRAIVQPPAD